MKCLVTFDKKKHNKTVFYVIYIAFVQCFRFVGNHQIITIIIQLGSLEKKIDLHVLHFNCIAQVQTISNRTPPLMYYQLKNLRKYLVNTIFNTHK